MYGLVINGANMQITVRGDQGFDFPIFTSSQGDNPVRRNLAIEMVAVLNRDLENRANDIANTPENITTSAQPQLRPWQKHVNEHRRFGGCTDKECTVCPPGRMTKDKFVLNDGGIPGQEDESGLKIYGTVTRAVENYAGVGDGPDVGVEEPKVLDIPESSPGAKEI